MSLIMGQSAPIDPLVFDDEEAIGALASSIMYDVCARTLACIWKMLHNLYDGR